MPKVKEVMFVIRGMKALGDGDSLIVFYQKSWNTVGDSIYKLVKEAFEGRPFEDINKTLLVLTPKNEKPELMNQFRIISLYNVIYKCVTKVLISKLKPMLP